MSTVRRDGLAIVGTDAKREAGKRVRTYVLDRIAATGIGSLAALAREADVAYDTLHAWFRGRAPRPDAGGKVAAALGVTYADLLDAYEGTTRPAGRWLSDEELRAVIDAAAEAAVRRVMRDRNG